MIILDTRIAPKLLACLSLKLWQRTFFIIKYEHPLYQFCPFMIVEGLGKLISSRKLQRGQCHYTPDNIFNASQHYNNSVVISTAQPIWLEFLLQPIQVDPQHRMQSLHYSRSTLIKFKIELVKIRQSNGDRQPLWLQPLTNNLILKAAIAAWQNSCLFLAWQKQTDLNKNLFLNNHTKTLT